MATMEDSEVTSGKFSSENYAQKWITELHNY